MARRRIVPLGIACAVLLTCSSAWAQEPPPPQNRGWGLTASYPGAGGTIGLVWQTSERWAFRPELSFAARFAGENSNTDTSTVGFAVTALRYMARKDNASVYLGPRFSYSRSSTSNSDSVSALTTTNSTYGVGASVGLQYEVTRRIAVYGEVGAVYSYQKATYEGNVVTPGDVTFHNITSRGAIGLNLHF